MVFRHKPERIIKQMATINRIGTHQGVKSLIKSLASRREGREESKIQTQTPGNCFCRQGLYVIGDLRSGG